MSRTSWLRRVYLQYFSKPAANRDLLLFASQQPIHSILEVGMGDGERIGSLMKYCKPADPSERLRYAALDPFESEGGSRLTLKRAHRILQELGVKAHLIPGDIATGVARVSHTVLPSDLVIIDGRWDDGSKEAEVLAQWLPRLCHSGSGVFAARREGGKLIQIPTPASASVTGIRIRAAA